MDQNYLLATARYIELNPVRAGMVGILKPMLGVVPELISSTWMILF